MAESSDDDFAGMQRAMDAQSSPVTSPTRKRTRTPDDEGTDNEDNNATNNENPPGSTGPGSNIPQTIPASVNKNLLVISKKYAQKKKLRNDQLLEVDTFLSDDPGQRQIKMFINQLALGNQLEKIVSSAPAFQVSDSLKKNIRGFAFAVIGSKNLHAYKKSSTVNVILEMLKTHRYDLPPGIEKNRADWQKVVSATDYELTQARAKFKKEVVASVKPTKGSDADTTIDPALLDADKTNIYDLTSKLISGTRCVVSVQLCARVALMRKVVLKHKGDKYWDKVDEKLVHIRKAAGNDKTKITKAMKHILDEDRARYGTSTQYEIQEGETDDWLDDVDTAASKATD